MKATTRITYSGDVHWAKMEAHHAIEEVFKGVSGGEIWHGKDFVKWESIRKEVKRSKWEER